MSTVIKFSFILQLEHNFVFSGTNLFDFLFMKSRLLSIFSVGNLQQYSVMLLYLLMIFSLITAK